MPAPRFGRFPKPEKGSTILFPVRRDASGKVTEALLAMKKRGFGAGWWNGAGGKVHDGETFEEAAAREASEEIGISPKKLELAMELSFFFPHKPAWDQTARVYLCAEWGGEPSESEEMRPAWFAPADIPFAQMWPSDDLWIPRVLAGEILEGAITFDENNRPVAVDIRRADPE